MQIKPMFVGNLKYLNSIVIVLDEYVVARKPDGIDSKGKAIWNKNSEYTELGALLHDYKYQNKSENETVLASTLIDYLKNKEEYRTITHITTPPSGKKGNSIVPIISLVASALNISYIDIFVKNQNFVMYDENIEERKKYIDMFSCKQPLPKECELLIVDDFVESGATFAGCLKALETQGQSSKNIKLLAFTFTKKAAF